MVNGKTVVLGITGGIAAYKAADLSSKLVQAGHDVRVVMTRSATEFITPLTFRSLTNRPVVTDMFELASEFSMEHIGLAEAADVVAIVPATANIIAKLAAGIADDILCTTVLATTVPVILAPAMNDNMYNNPITRENLSRLVDRGFTVIGPEQGRLASGKIGIGRLAATEKILDGIKLILEKSNGPNR